MKLFFREQDGKILLVGKAKKYEAVQAVFDSWEMARRMFPNIKLEKPKKEIKNAE